MLRTFVQFTALLQAVISSFFLVKGVFVMRPSDMAEVSATKCGYNPDILKSLAGQRADVSVGSMLLLLSLILQILNFLWPLRWKDLTVSYTGVVVALVSSAIIGFLAYRLSLYLCTKWYRQAENILAKKISPERNSNDSGE